jgi:uncharacterized membrane protein
MRTVVLVILLRLALLVAIAASAALYVEYQHAGDPAFCGVGSGCLAVRMSPYSRFQGVPLPTIGLAAYAGLFIFFLVGKGRRHLHLGAILTGAGALSACVFIYLQAAVIHALCKWCIAVDTSAILAAAAAFMLYDQAKTDAKADEGPTSVIAALSRSLPILAAWALAGALAIGAPFIWGKYPVIAPLLPPIAALEVPGKITVVSFTDFECPFCRKLHPLLHELLEKHKDRLVVVRRMMPLPIHPGAMPAALAYTCTPLDERPAMVDALYGAPEHFLTREGTTAIANGLGLPSEAFARCVDAPETRAQVEKDIKLFAEIEGMALPLTYVGPRVILGYNPDGLRAAVALALQGDQLSLPVSWMFALLSVIFTMSAVVTLRLAPRSSARGAHEDRAHSR